MFQATSGLQTLDYARAVLTVGRVTDRTQFVGLRSICRLRYAQQCAVRARRAGALEQVIEGKGSLEYGTAVDWWAMGTLVYEMLSGRPPFYNGVR